MASREARISWGGRTQGGYCLILPEVRACRDTVGDHSDANSTLEANKHMQAELRPRRRDLELVALHRRRSAVLSLIRSLERYQRARVRHMPAAEAVGRRLK
jgi:hypothetical protein